MIACVGPDVAQLFLNSAAADGNKPCIAAKSRITYCGRYTSIVNLN
jgi:hypothetical protein